jgi:hypothetical protein
MRWSRIGTRGSQAPEENWPAGPDRDAPDSPRRRTHPGVIEEIGTRRKMTVAHHADGPILACRCEEPRQPARGDERVVVEEAEVFAPRERRGEVDVVAEAFARFVADSPHARRKRAQILRGAVVGLIVDDQHLELDGWIGGGEQAVETGTREVEPVVHGDQNRDARHGVGRRDLRRATEISTADFNGPPVYGLRSLEGGVRVGVLTQSGSEGAIAGYTNFPCVWRLRTVAAISGYVLCAGFRTLA